jgi:hypothetical protein
LFVASTWIPPSAPAVTMLVLSTTPPCMAFRTTVPGQDVSSAQAASQPTGCPNGVMDTKFIEYAAAAGTPQLDKGTGMTRGWPPTSEGGPNGPVFPEPPSLRVSITRQGVMEMNISPEALLPAAALWSVAAGSLDGRTAQFFTGIESCRTCAELSGISAVTAAQAMLMAKRFALCSFTACRMAA